MIIHRGGKLEMALGMRRTLCMVLMATAVWGGRIAVAQPAPDANSVLILDTTVVGGASSNEATKAAALGFTVDVVTAVQWAAKSTADFGTYKAIILGDPTCNFPTPAPLAPAEANKTTWGPAITGNVIVIGTDPSYHSSFGPGGPEGGDDVTQKGIAFAAAQAGATGAYIALSCYYANALSGTPVPVLDPFGSFTTSGTGTCFNNAHIVATHPALAGLTDANISNWSCSVHEILQSWPPNFLVLAIALNLGSAFTASDGTHGTPYIVASGQGLVAIGGRSLAPTLSSAGLAVSVIGLLALGFRSVRRRQHSR